MHTVARVLISNPIFVLIVINKQSINCTITGDLCCIWFWQD